MVWRELIRRKLTCEGTGEWGASVKPGGWRQAGGTAERKPAVPLPETGEKEPGRKESRHESSKMVEMPTLTVHCKVLDWNPELVPLPTTAEWYC